MTVLSPAVFLPTRQVIVSGRAAERLTEAAFDVTGADLVYRFGAVTGPVPVTFHAKPAGYYALQMDPNRGFPDMTGAGTVTLELTLTLAGGATHVLSTDVPEADLLPVTRTVTIAGTDHTARYLPGVPVTLDLRLDPPAPQLQGQVMLGNNPATPAAGLDVTVGALPVVTTDADGVFRTGPLPLTPSVPLTLSDGTDTVNLTHFTDFATPLNTGTFSFQPDPI